MTPFAYNLVQTNDTDGLRLFLDTHHEEDVDSIPRGKAMNALILAAKQNNTNMIQILIDFGCNVHTVYKKDRTAAHYAISNNNITALEMLIKAGARPNNPDTQNHKLYRWTFLHELADSYVNNSSNLELETKLFVTIVNAHADINSCNIYGHTPLTLAIENNRSHLLRLLFDAGVNINIRRHGQTLYEYALGHSNECAQMILEEHAKRESLILSNDTRLILKQKTQTKSFL